MSKSELEMPALDGDLAGFKFIVKRESWYEKSGAFGRPLTVAVIVGGTYINSDDAKAYAYDNAKSILRAAKRAKKTALKNIAYNRAQRERYSKWEGSYPPKNLSEV